MPNDAQLAKRYWQLKHDLKNLQDEQEEIAAHFKTSTGDRICGDYLVSVTSSNREVIDQQAVKALLGANTPMKSTPTVSLSVKILSGVAA